MTRRSPRILLTLCCLLAFTTSAHAECAWVLWGEFHTLKGYREWTLIQAHKTEQQCEAFQERKVKEASKDADSVTGNMTFKRMSDGDVWIHRFLCVPDTVDPRGPKGK